MRAGSWLKAPFFRVQRVQRPEAARPSGHIYFLVTYHLAVEWLSHTDLQLWAMGEPGCFC